LADRDALRAFAGEALRLRPNLLDSATAIYRARRSRSAMTTLLRRCLNFRATSRCRPGASPHWFWRQRRNELALLLQGRHPIISGLIILRIDRARRAFFTRPRPPSSSRLCRERDEVTSLPNVTICRNVRAGPAHAKISVAFISGAGRHYRRRHIAISPRSAAGAIFERMCPPAAPQSSFPRC